MECEETVKQKKGYVIAHEDAQSQNTLIKCRRGQGEVCLCNAFTLAEVLITLGIIGVVAALTLPTLIQHHRKSVVETRLAKFYSTMNQAIQRAEVDYGDKMNWEMFEKGYETDEDGNSDLNKPSVLSWFNKYLKPYLQEPVDVEVFGNSSTEGMIKVLFNDGSAMLFGGGGISYYPDSKNIKTSISSITGALIRDNSNSGTSYFSFMYSPIETAEANKYHYRKGIEPYLYNWKGDMDKLRTDSYVGCKKEEPQHGRAFCTALIMMNGWKIPDDYPLKF